MPSFLVPRHVSTHRIAAIALYRALLNPSRHVALQSQQRSELQNIVRNRFKQTQHVHSYRRLRLAFQAGYEAIDHLDAAAAGKDESTKYLAGLLERAPPKVKASPVRKPLRAETKKSELSTADASTVPGSKPSVRIFARPKPLDQLAGKRHVPVLVSANSIPVLRITKPQSPRLSIFITQRIKQRQKRHNLRHELAQQEKFAAYEDSWDVELAERHGIDTDVWDAVAEGDIEPSWTEEPAEAHRVVGDLIGSELQKNKEMAEKMQAVVDREQELFDKEREQRQAVRRLERIERRRLRREGAVIEDVPEVPKAAQ